MIDFMMLVQVARERLQVAQLQEGQRERGRKRETETETDREFKMGKDTGNGRAGRQRDREPEEKGRAEPDRLKEIPIDSNVREGDEEDNQLWPGKQLCASFANPSSSCCALLAMLWPCPTQPQAMHIIAPNH